LDLDVQPGPVVRVTAPSVSSARLPAATDLDAARLMAEAPVVLAVLRAVLPREADAEDVLGTTLEIALRRQGQLRDPALLRPWLIAIAVREGYRLRRRLKLWLRLDSVAELEVHPSLLWDESLAIRQALRGLAPRTRLAVVLHHLVGLPVDEVAEALGTSPNTVKTQLRLGLRRLREDLEK
jgi:RNA polymerase sigma factor (sigma-70 family)